MLVHYLQNDPTCRMSTVVGINILIFQCCLLMSTIKLGKTCDSMQTGALKIYVFF